MYAAACVRSVETQQYRHLPLGCVFCLRAWIHLLQPRLCGLYVISCVVGKHMYAHVYSSLLRTRLALCPVVGEQGRGRGAVTG